MNNIWYKRVGFFNNPFSIKPAAYHDNLSGLGNTVDDISYAILTKKLVFVEGEYGQGKTSILKKLINDFGGKKQVAYFSCNRLDGRLDIQRLLKSKYGFLGRLFDLEAKDMILLLDEAQYLGEDDYKELSEHHKNGGLKSIVFVSPKINGDANGLLSKSLVVNLKKVNQTEAVNIIRQRVGHLHLLSDDIINKIFEKSNRNIRELMKNCEKLCKYAVDNEMTKVTEELVYELLGEEEKKPVKMPVKKAAKKTTKKSTVKKKRETKVKKEEKLAEEPKEELIAVEEELKEELHLEEEEDELDRQVKEMALAGDDDIDETEEPKRRKKADSLPKLESEDLLSEEDYY